MQESEIATWPADVDLGKEQRIREASARRAWHSAKQMVMIREADRTRSDKADLDDMLEEVSLRDGKTESGSATNCGSQQTSRPRAPWSAVAIAGRAGGCSWFSTCGKRGASGTRSRRPGRSRIAESLFVVDAVEEDTLQRTVDQYLDQMYTYLLALAIAGAWKAPGCPQATEALGAESTSYVGPARPHAAVPLEGPPREPVRPEARPPGVVGETRHGREGAVGIQLPGQQLHLGRGGS